MGGKVNKYHVLKNAKPEGGRKLLINKFMLGVKEGSQYIQVNSFCLTKLHSHQIKSLQSVSTTSNSAQLACSLVSNMCNSTLLV
jgi:hypothetical protein